jgi:hypothetical protein
VMARTMVTMKHWLVKIRLAPGEYVCCMPLAEHQAILRHVMNAVTTRALLRNTQADNNTKPCVSFGCLTAATVALPDSHS